MSNPNVRAFSLYPDGDDSFEGEATPEQRLAERLERGEVVHFPRSPFALPAGDDPAACPAAARDWARPAGVARFGHPDAVAAGFAVAPLWAAAGPCAAPRRAFAVRPARKFGMKSTAV